MLQRVYSQYPGVTVSMEGSDVALTINTPQDPNNDNSEIVNAVSLFKRNALAAPFETAFESCKKKLVSPLMVIHYRSNELLFLRASADRVTVIFSTVFTDEDDRIYAKLFLQEFVDARKTPAMQTTPQVIYSKDAPSEITVPVASDPNTSYVTFGKGFGLFVVFFPRHLTDENISKIIMFRDYFHYHIKASKAYMHSRMRARVHDFLKILNRARPERAVEAKTAQGKTFKR